MYYNLTNDLTSLNFSFIISKVRTMVLRKYCYSAIWKNGKLFIKSSQHKVFYIQPWILAWPVVRFRSSQMCMGKLPARWTKIHLQKGWRAFRKRLHLHWRIQANSTWHCWNLSLQKKGLVSVLDNMSALELISLPGSDLPKYPLRGLHIFLIGTNFIKQMVKCKGNQLRVYIYMLKYIFDTFFMY